MELLIPIVLGASAAGFFLGKWGWKKHKAKSAKKKRESIAKDLHPYFNESQVETAYKLFIETKGQNVAPSRDAEPGRRHAFSTKESLIPKFLKTFQGDQTDGRFFLVLADSGMGKTTFMINLYLRYREQVHKDSYHMELIPLGYEKLEEKLKEFEQNKTDRNTILLLDAFDEDAEAAKDYKRRIDEVVELTKNFRFVLITCRTQFFPNEDEVPGEIKVRKPDPLQPGFHRFLVMFLSPFDDEDIQGYLNKKYSDSKPETAKKKQHAKEIVKRSPSLMVRPMLLANIDDLLEDTDRNYAFTYEIYEVLIEKWLARESGRKEKGEREKFHSELGRFSEKLALQIYASWKEDQQMHIKLDGLSEFKQIQSIQLEDIDMTSRSLLNRDGDGNWKFSHKSIWEYFLAQEALKNSAFLQDFQFVGMNMVKTFLSEYGILPEMVKVIGGQFKMGSNEYEDERPIHEVLLSDFEIGKYPVTQKLWGMIMQENPSHFKGERLPVEQVSWNEVQEFLEKLNQKFPGMNYRLPTESEWEYAARGGNASKGFKYSGSNRAGDVAWFERNSEHKTHPVGGKTPNELGIYDMSGNVWEWCQDWYADYPMKLQHNPQGPNTGVIRILRGGSWGSRPYSLRITNRNNRSPDFRYINIGFRLSRNL